ncbi:trypsin-like serine protease [Streptomyces polygonati]|uniref:Trypsin-like serine protease n=1 Tax=Streptomyces polygonati TaxID=1617087 RepID=A0ABV8HQL6_9ACTN
MKVLRRGGRRSALGAVVPLGVVALCAAGLVVAGPAHADAGAGDSTEPRVIGGSPPSLDAHTWLVGLSDGQPHSTVYPCDGVLIAPDKVLTSAYCDRDGSLTGVSGTNAYGTGYHSDISSVWVDPSYHQGAVTADNDIAVLTLSTPFTFADNFLNLPVATANDAALYQSGTQATA